MLLTKMKLKTTWVSYKIFSYTTKRLWLLIVTLKRQLDALKHVFALLTVSHQSILCHLKTIDLIHL